MALARLLGVLLAAAAGVQLVGGLPLAEAPFVELPGDAAAGLLYDGVAPGPEGLGRLVSTRRASVERAARPRAHRDLAMAYLLEAERRPEGEAQRFSVAAEAEFLSAARLAPADPTVWAMVPFAALRREDPARAAELLRSGLRVIPYAPDYALNRLAVLIALEGERDAELEGALPRILADAARQNLRATARLLLERGAATTLPPRITNDPELAYELARAIERVAEEEASERDDGE